MKAKHLPRFDSISNLDAGALSKNSFWASAISICRLSLSCHSRPLPPGHKYILNTILLSKAYHRFTLNYLSIPFMQHENAYKIYYKYIYICIYIYVKAEVYDAQHFEIHAQVKATESDESITFSKPK